MKSIMVKCYIDNHSSDFRVLLYFGIVTFVYALCVGVFIQLYAIPIMFPRFNFGNGLAVLDSVGFDIVARERAAEIIEKGWSVWKLRPNGQMPSGIASAFYALWVPKPYAMLPFNALVHALSGCLVVWMLRHFFSWTPAILGGALFVLNPAAMEWVAQIHRDGVFVLGNLMVLACMFQLSKNLDSSKVKNSVSGVILGLIGTFVVWVARPFWVQVIFVSIMLWIFTLILLFIFTDKSANEN